MRFFLIYFNPTTKMMKKPRYSTISQKKSLPILYDKDHYLPNSKSYYCLIATTASIFDACDAGIIPAKIPMNTERPNPSNIFCADRTNSKEVRP
jgi:hypothetical protein